MFRMYNHVDQQSPIKGWNVETQSAKNRTDRKNHNICLSGTERGIHLALDRNKYEDLTLVNGGMTYPNINVFTKLYSIYLGADRYLPIVTTAESAEENRNILLFNYETAAGEVIADVEFINLIPISHYITNKDFKSRITFAAIDKDNTKDYGVKIKYGFSGGRKLQVEEIKFTSYNNVLENIKKNSDNNKNTPIEFFNINNSHETVENIQAARLNIPRMDLSDICINPQ